MKRTFLFLELLDPEVNFLILQIKEILTGRRFLPPIHLTLRGPYEGQMPGGALERYRDIMRYDVIRIAGVGKFRNPEEEVLYLSVDSTHMRDVWWKPDFPIGTYGFEPHLSLYRGEDRGLVDLAAAFLSQQHIDLLCAEHRLVAARTRQYELLTEYSNQTQTLTRLIEAGRIREGLLDDLRALVGSYRARGEAAG
jgi:hypothetical protein